MVESDENELLLWRGRRSWWLFSRDLLVILVIGFVAALAAFWHPLLVAFAVIGFPVELPKMVLILAALAVTQSVLESLRRYQITTKQATIELYGVLGHRVLEVDLAYVHSVELRQRGIQRLFNIGTMTIHAHGSSAGVVFSGIPQTRAVHELVLQAVRGRQAAYAQGKT